MRELSLDCLEHVSGGCFDFHNCQGINDFGRYMMDSQQPGAGEDGIGGGGGSSGGGLPAGGPSNGGAVQRR